MSRSAGWSAVSWRNQPIGAPPLWSWPVECRKRGPVAGRGRALRPIAEQRPDAGERLVAGRRRGDERLEAEVGVGAAPGEVAGQLPDDVAGARGEPERRIAVEREAVAAGDRLGRAGRVRGAAVAAGPLEQVAGQLLGLFDVRLVERVHADDRPVAIAIAIATSQRTNSAPISIGSVSSIRMTG